VERERRSLALGKPSLFLVQVALRRYLLSAIIDMLRTAQESLRPRISELKKAVRTELRTCRFVAGLNIVNYFIPR
jgi:seryl-tRNA(Sec) selenium transferase